MQHQSFPILIDAVRVFASIQQELKDENWVQGINEEMNA